ncbi:50S ribosomal protein L10 [Flavobacteriaceae bacterium UJ101]|nr:50S ribosomal protein L10 [Flavobacteriaceae bacterium UJ101]
MTRETKAQAIEELKGILADNATIYLADISELNASQSSELRRNCFKNGVKLQVVKNTLLKKAMEASDKEFDELYGSLKGNTSIMIAEQANAPAKVIKDFRKKAEKPILKGAWIEESCYVGDDQLDALVAIKSKEELIGEIVTLLQSPAKNVLSALQSGGSTVSGLVKALSERAE